MMQALTKKRNQLGNKGFSLIELIIVIAIMAALIAILAPQYLKYVEKSRVAADETIADSIYGAVQVAAADPEVALAAGAYTVTWDFDNGGYVVAPTTTTTATTATADALEASLTESLGATSGTNPVPMKAAVHTADYVVTLTVTAATTTDDESIAITETAGW